MYFATNTRLLWVSSVPDVAFIAVQRHIIKYFAAQSVLMQTQCAAVKKYEVCVLCCIV